MVVDLIYTAKWRIVDPPRIRGLEGRRRRRRSPTSPAGARGSGDASFSPLCTVARIGFERGRSEKEFLRSRGAGETMCTRGDGAGGGDGRLTRGKAGRKSSLRFILFRCRDRDISGKAKMDIPVTWNLSDLLLRCLPEKALLYMRCSYRHVAENQRENTKLLLQTKWYRIWTESQ
jgi:hypothetical protein